jgi:hypothetical protein
VDGEVTTVGSGYPRLTDGLAVIPVASGFVVDGGRRREHFSGRTASAVFPRLLPMLDGTRPIPEVAQALGLPATAVQRVVEMLCERGVVRTHPAPAEAGRNLTTMRIFLRRVLPAGHGERVDRRLGAARVRVSGTGAIADLVMELLRRSGVGEVTAPPDRSAPTLVVDVSSGGAEAQSPGHHAGVPVLPVRRLPGRVLIGPLSNVPGVGCERCRPARPHDDDTVDGPVAPAGELASAGLAAGLAVGAALRFLAGQGTSAALDGVVVAGPTGVLGVRRAARAGDCPHCGTIAPGLESEELSETLSDHVAHAPSASWGIDEPDLSHRLAHARAYLTQPRFSAPPHRAVRTREERRAADLRWMLTGGGGRARGLDVPAWQPFRAAATGCPGSTRAYLLGDVRGTGPGVFYFDASSGEFVVLPGRPEFDPDRIVMVLTGDLPVLEPVLGDADRRVVYQDAGLAMARMRVLAGAAGWKAYAVPEPAGPLSALLELDPRREIVTAVVELEPSGKDGARNPPPRRPPRPPRMYGFTTGAVEARPVVQTVRAAMAGARQIADHVPSGEPALGCLLYARHIVGLPRGLYDLGADAGPSPLPHADPAPIEAAMADRELDAAAVVLFTGAPGAALAAEGEAGYRTLLGHAATTAGLLRDAAGASGLAAGLYSRLPGWLAAACTAAQRADLVLFGVALGHPAGSPAGREEEHIRW